ncbi:hypothetical protein ACFL0V_02155 [Nanoarchaeota archaeon]
MILEYLESIRKISTLNTELKKFMNNRLVKQYISVSQHRPYLPDKQILMLTGLKEELAEMLICLWAFKKEVEAWSANAKPDLCHELRATSIELRKYGIMLEELGFLKQTFAGRAIQSSNFKPEPINKVIKRLQKLVTENSRVYKFLPKLYKKKISQDEKHSFLASIEDHRKKNANIITKFLSGKLGRLSSSRFGVSPINFMIPILRRYEALPDKYLLVRIGFTENEAEILILLWTLKEKVIINKIHGKISIANELGTTIDGVIKKSSRLRRFKLVSLSKQGKNMYLLPTSTPESVTSGAIKMFNNLNNLLGKLESEWKKTKINENSIKYINIENRVMRKINAAMRRKELIAGFFVGEYDVKGKTIFVSGMESVNITVRNGKHFVYDWQKYYKKLKELKVSEKLIVSEFHTHPYEENVKLHPIDMDRMRMLQRGQWIIFAKNEAKPFFWHRKGKKKLVFSNIKIK